MSRRSKIGMSEQEVREYLENRTTLILCSNGKGGAPHPMPMWYALEDDGSVVMTTFTKSQKVRNLERDPNVSLLVEDGDAYSELTGVVLYGRVELTRETESVLDVLARVTARKHAAEGADPEAMRNALRAQAEKRVVLRVRPDRVVSWDHSKLAGAY